MGGRNLHRRSGKWGALAAGLVVCGALAVAIPLSRSRAEALRAEICRQNIQFMMFALAYYAADWGDRLPPAGPRADGYFWVKPVLGMDVGVRDAPNYFGMAPMKITCPSAQVKRGVDAGPEVVRGALRGRRIHFMCNPGIGNRKWHDLAGSQTVLAYDCAPVHRGGRNCCLADGHVKWMAEDHFQRRLRGTAAEEG